MKKMSLLLVCVALSVFVLAGCSSESKPSKEEAQKRWEQYFDVPLDVESTSGKSLATCYNDETYEKFSAATLNSFIKDENASASNGQFPTENTDRDDILAFGVATTKCVANYNVQN